MGGTSSEAGRRERGGGAGEGANSVACWIAYGIEFPMHLLVAFRCLVAAFGMSFAWLFATFWQPFGTFWTPWATFFGPRDDSWPISGPGSKKVRKWSQVGWTLVAPGVANLRPFWLSWWFFSGLFFVVFLGTHFAHKLQFRCPFGVQFVMVFGYLGPLEIGLKRWRGYDFRTLEMLFAGMVSKLDRVDVFLKIFMIFSTFWLPSGECFGTKRWTNGVWKNKQTSSRIFSWEPCDWFQLIPRLAPCGPLKEFKKSAILRDWPQGAVLKATGNQQLAIGNQQLAIGNWFSH